MDKELWERVREQLESSLPNKKKVWFKKVFFVSSTEDEITLGLNSSFCLQGLERNGIEEIVNTASEFAGHQVSIKLIVTDQKAVQESSKQAEREDGRTTSSQKPSSQSSTLSEKGKKTDESSVSAPYGTTSTQYSMNEETHLNPHYTFDNFVVGDNNNFAYNAAKVISRNPGLSYNPCLIYGGVGLGKTHLLQAIGNYIVKDNPKMNVLYITAESFTNELINAIFKKNASTLFKKKYRSVDVLLIDDIHFLQDKESSQEELFHTFNDLTERNKQIVFTCDRPITELKGITERLRTRFTKGTNVDLQPPLYETRMAIVQKKCEEMHYDIPRDIQELICQNIKTNVRDLEGALITLDSFSKLVGKEITKKVALDHIRNFIPATVLKESEITIDKIIDETGKYFNIPSSELKSRSRNKNVATPRHIAIYIASEMTTRSLSEIGKSFNIQDHTSVKYAIDKIAANIKEDEDLKNIISNIKKAIMDENDDRIYR